MHSADEVRDLGLDLVYHAKFLLQIISQIYDKVAALKIHEITSKSVIVQVRSASNIFHLLYHKVRYLEHYSSSAFSLVSCCQTYLLLKGINEINRLTKVYRAVRILRNERSRFGRDLSPEDLKWTDRYLEQCRYRGLHLINRKYAVELLQKIEERSALYRLFLSEELSRKIADPNSPINFKVFISESLKDFVKTVAVTTNYVQTVFEIKQTINPSNKKYSECVKQLKSILQMRDMLAKMFGCRSYMQLSIQSQSLSRIQVKKFMKRILYIHEAFWLQILDESRDLKIKANEEVGNFPDVKFEAMDAHYYYNVTPSIEFAPLYLYFPIKATIAKILGLIGDYFGIQFSHPVPFLDHPDIKSSTVVDIETGRTLGRLVLDIFSRKYKRYRKTTLAFHNGNTEFYHDFLPQLGDDIKQDPRFERFENLNKLPVTCFLFLNLNKRVAIVETAFPKSSDDGMTFSFKKPSSGKRFRFTKSHTYKIARQAKEKLKEHANPVRTPSKCKVPSEVNPVSNDDNQFFTILELSQIFYELGNVLQHLFCQADSPNLRTCCSNKDFTRIPCAMLQHLLLQPQILQSISTHRFTGKQLSLPQAYDLMRSYKWEEPLTILQLVQHSYLDYFAHTERDFEPMSAVKRFSSEYLTITDISDLQCPDWLFSLGDQNSGSLYADAWAYHVSKAIFDVTFKARNLNPQVGRDFRRYFLEPDVDVNFYVRLRMFLRQDLDTKSSLERDSPWFSEFKDEVFSLIRTAFLVLVVVVTTFRYETPDEGRKGKTVETL